MVTPRKKNTQPLQPEQAKARAFSSEAHFRQVSILLLAIALLAAQS